MCFRTLFYSQKFPVNRQNTVWQKSSHSTVLRNPSGGLKFFLVVVEASNWHHVSCTYSNWRKWVQFGPTHSMAIFGRCEKFTSVIAIFVKSQSTVLRNTSGGPKLFLVVVEALKSHHASCIHSIWRKWVHFGPTHSKLIFGLCEKFTSVIAIFVKTFLCTLRHPKTTWYHSKA